MFVNTWDFLLDFNVISGNSANNLLLLTFPDELPEIFHKFCSIWVIIFPERELWKTGSSCLSEMYDDKHIIDYLINHRRAV